MREEGGTVSEDTRQEKRGGRRAGAGRPRIAADKKQERPNHGIRAWPDEWGLIQRFSRAVRLDKEMASVALEILEKHIEKREEGDGQHDEKH
jgi:hypothetical protein